ncbi:unnamed protein product [Rotaria sp. Silwood2]|nr:unnamed protein product [Rotaria sp. Silwood2]CAF2791493.1 unnamed protein product [Rotaria sp. Silwood2]CAF3219242.1 unnamed protein product [Rotaria sp. Silwood2]CAF4117952.1 unnamed protein product [Rotaria sp. Silwood2]CAF4359119.1 unnamed protein product [Rotaria sp. Silwood2]
MLDEHLYGYSITVKIWGKNDAEKYIRSIALCINFNKFPLFDISSSPKTNLSSVSISESTSVSSTKTSSEHSSSTTFRPYYPDTFSPGSIAGIIIASLVFIIVVSVSAFYIRRQQIYYLPYYNNYRRL